MPRAYWLDKPTLASHIMLIQPSEQEFKRVQKAIQNAKLDTYDMEIINKLYGRICAVLPHRTYALLTGEFRTTDHSRYLGDDGQAWDPEAAIREAKFVHFSDHPLPKPWEETSKAQVEKAMPPCEVDDNVREDCRAREIWLDLYRDFKERRKVSFKEDFVCVYIFGN